MTDDRSISRRTVLGLGAMSILGLGGGAYLYTTEWMDEGERPHDTQTDLGRPTRRTGPPTPVRWTGAGEAFADQSCAGSKTTWTWLFVPRHNRPTPSDATLRVSFDDSSVTVVEPDERYSGRGSAFEVTNERGASIVDAAIISTHPRIDGELILVGTDCTAADRDESSGTGPPTYWQVDFGAGATPPIPPRYHPNDVMAALGSADEGMLENPSTHRQRSADQLGEVSIDDRAFAVDDPSDPTSIRVTFELAADATARTLHLALFELPGPFNEDDIEDQRLVSATHDRFVGGESGMLSIDIPRRRL